MKTELEKAIDILTNLKTRRVSDSLDLVVRLDDVIDALDGIDMDESRSIRGWWPNPQGAKFGKNVLAKIKMKSFTA